MAVFETRYVQYGLEYEMQTWGPKSVEHTQGDVCELPDWVANAVTVAKVGDHIRKVERPPPEFIVWFKHDEHGTVLGYTHNGQPVPEPHELTYITGVPA